MADFSNMSPMAGDIAAQMSGRAEDYVNSDEVELAWAMKAHEHASIHMNLITAVDPSALRLCKHDQQIYDSFRRQFPEFDIETVDEEKLKSPTAKQAWRDFIDEFKEVEDFNYGTLLRLKANDVYTPENTTFATRIQFLAIEVARNREGVNTRHRDAYTTKHKAE